MVNKSLIIVMANVINMSGVTMKTDNNAAQAVFRCLYTPSVCHVRKLVIN